MSGYLYMQLGLPQIANQAYVLPSLILCLHRYICCHTALGSSVARCRLRFLWRSFPHQSWSSLCRGFLRGFVHCIVHVVDADPKFGKFMLLLLPSAASGLAPCEVTMQQGQ